MASMFTEARDMTIPSPDDPEWVRQQNAARAFIAQQPDAQLILQALGLDGDHAHTKPTNRNDLGQMTYRKRRDR